MKQEDKELLLKDLCARLPYGIKCRYQHIQYIENSKIIDINMFGRVNVDGHVKDICDVKPYLFPLSSMTEEQCYELSSIRSGFQDCWKYIKTPIPLSICNFEQIDWFHKNHFDYRGLIPMELAIDATAPKCRKYIGWRISDEHPNCVGIGYDFYDWRGDYHCNTEWVSISELEMCQKNIWI